jgi:hypothetical protein
MHVPQSTRVKHKVARAKGVPTTEPIHGSIVDVRFQEFTPSAPNGGSASDAVAPFLNTFPPGAKWAVFSLYGWEMHFSDGDNNIAQIMAEVYYSPDTDTLHGEIVLQDSHGTAAWSGWVGAVITYIG